MPLPNWHGLLIPLVTHVFAELGISVAVWIHADRWHPIHSARSIMSFEYDFDVISRRWSYNRIHLERCAKRRQIVVGKHAGFYDLFVPIQDQKDLRGILVAGPFAVERPTSGDLRERWLAISRCQARMSDPAFAQYLSASLSALTFEGPLLDVFKAFTACFADLVVGHGDSTALATQAHVHSEKLVQARFADRMWEAARVMIDPRTTPAWAVHRFGEMAALGVDQFPKHALVGLLRSREKHPEPVDDALRRDAFQRACVVFARKLGGVICGQVGDHGIVFLIDRTNSASRIRAALTEIAMRTATIARRFGLILHAGMSDAAGSNGLSLRYGTALAAAEKAVSQGVRVAYAEPRPERSREVLRSLRRELGASVQDSKMLSPRFERYIDAALHHSGYRLEAMRAELEAGLERLADPLLAHGFLDEKSFAELRSSTDHAAENAVTAMDLVGSYRRVISDIEGVLQSPTIARHDRGTRRALNFMREHLADPLTLQQVARAAGFAPDYFWRLFKRDEGMTFAHHLLELRIARAKQLLKDSALDVEQIGKLCGIQSRATFHRVFRKETGRTPNEYRGRGPN